MLRYVTTRHYNIKLSVDKTDKSWIEYRAMNKIRLFANIDGPRNINNYRITLGQPERQNGHKSDVLSTTPRQELDRS